MTTYTIEYADGRVNDIVADNDRDAMTAAKHRIGDHAVISDEWDQRGEGQRKLIWVNEAAAANDDGSNAIAELVRSDDDTE